MQFLKTLFWVLLAVLVALFASRNWNDVTLNLWGDIQADIKVPDPAADRRSCSASCRPGSSCARASGRTGGVSKRWSGSRRPPLLLDGRFEEEGEPVI